MHYASRTLACLEICSFCNPEKPSRRARDNKTGRQNKGKNAQTNARKKARQRRKKTTPKAKASKKATNKQQTGSWPHSYTVESLLTAHAPGCLFLQTLAQTELEIPSGGFDEFRKTSQGPFEGFQAELSGGARFAFFEGS